MLPDEAVLSKISKTAPDKAGRLLEQYLAERWDKIGALWIPSAMIGWNQTCHAHSWAQQ